MFKTFTEMPIWQQAMSISIRIFEITDNLPRKEDYGLTSQIRRSANSIGANIAEGFGRKYLKDKIKFYCYSRGSANETVHHLIYGSKIGYFDDETVNELTRELNSLIHEINMVIKTLQNWNHNN